MPLIELVGPPAVGKSTLVAAAVRHGAVDVRRDLLEARHPVLAPLVPRARRTPGPGGPRRWVADRLLRDPGLARTEEALTAVAPGWREFLALVLDGPADPVPTTPEGLALAVMERGWLLDAVRLRALVATRVPGPDLALLDEGLTHPYKALAAAGGDPARLARYASLVPLPDVLVVVELDAAEHAGRVRARHGTTPGRVRWTALGRTVADATLDAELTRVRDTVATVVAAAEERGTPVVRLDATGSTPEALAARLVARVRTVAG